MEWASWRVMYLQIMDDLGFDTLADVASAERLSSLVGKGRVPNYDAIANILGRDVIIAGPAAGLEKDLESLLGSEILISAGSATGRLMGLGIIPAVLVTDLDGDVGLEIEAIERGSLAFVHAHGDNRARIEEVVPRLSKPFVPTVQCKPFGNVYNFGGFTDGDRAVLTALHFGAERIRTIGWDLDDPFPKEGCDPDLKRRKLSWAKKVLRPYLGGSQ